MPVVKFINEKKEIEVPVGANLRQEARAAGIGLYPNVHKVLNCRGFGFCGSCRVRILKGAQNASPMKTAERALFAFQPGPASLAYIGNEDTMRLACKVKVMGDMEVETKPPLNLFGENFFS